ncbi:MFS transporter [Subtercola frigoramans]|uniref:MFS family permease n=1 Tax=Subtercola frigoramans TaxID=120298 RepID=A0ABS2L957_9MICO|nr:MFS transporter [Subtercola frigoramans]MBM7473620.1 MFS family permease [Subtercola frigoramans]
MTKAPAVTIPTEVDDARPMVNGKLAGAPQGVILLAGSCMPVLAATLITPVLPSMSDFFASTPGAAALVPLLIGIPALVVAILAPFAGGIVDRFNRRTILLLGLVLYALVGTMPLYLDSLYAIAASRLAVGVAEAAIITCCTTLLGDYFAGQRRNRYFGLQAVVTALAATVFFALGGALGATGWRTPFWVYAGSLIIFAFMIPLISQPVGNGRSRSERAKLPPIPWARIAGPCIVAIFGGIVFYAVIVQLSYVLTGIGVSATAIIGLASAVASLATAAGAISFKRLARLQAKLLLPLGFTLAAVGLMVIWAAGSSFALVLVGAVIASAGTGILLPTMLTWAVAGLSFEERGRGTGLWTSAFFLGQFLSPLAVIALTGIAGALQPALGLLGIVSLVIAAIIFTVLRNRSTTDFLK